MTTDLTRLLQRASTGEPSVVDELMPMVYDQLRAFASNCLRGRSTAQMEPTAIVNEAYLKLVDQSRATYQNRVHFFAVAANAIRRILVDQVRSEGADKRGGSLRRTTLNTSCLGVSPSPAIELLDLNDALGRLAKEDSRAAQVLELRFFSGLSIEEVASWMELSTATVERELRYARAWLYRALETGETD